MLCQDDEASPLKRWQKPGLQCSGEAAHGMAPVGGVGITSATVEAVVVSNLRGPTLKAGTPMHVPDLPGAAAE